MVSFLAHEAKAKVSGLDHIDVVGAIANSQRDLSFSELLHEGDDLGFLMGGGTVYDDGLGVDEELSEFNVGEIVVKSNCNDHA